MTFLSACAGIDYSVKTLAVDNSQVALQLWDTAGQERWRPAHIRTCFTCYILQHNKRSMCVENTSSISPPFCFCRYRSITKQFFRKADGVVVIYDITDVQSFTAVRQWLTSVKARPRVLCRNATSRTNLLVELVFLCSIFSSAGWTEWSPSGCVFCNVVRKHRLSGFPLRSLQGS